MAEIAARRHLGFDPTGNGAVRTVLGWGFRGRRIERRHFRLDQIRDGGRSTKHERDRMTRCRVAAI